MTAATMTGDETTHRTESGSSSHEEGPAPSAPAPILTELERRIFYLPHLSQYARFAMKRANLLSADVPGVNVLLSP